MASTVVAINATASVVNAKLSLSVFSQMVNALTESAEVTFEIYSSGYSYEREWLFFGTESGASMKLVVRGKPVVVKHIIERLTGERNEDFFDEISINEEMTLRKVKEKILEFDKRITPEKLYVSKRAFLKDIFSSNTTVRLDIKGSNYRKSTTFMHHKESGLRIKVKISGRPEFTRAIVDHLNLFGPRIEGFLSEY